MNAHELANTTFSPVAGMLAGAGLGGPPVLMETRYQFKAFDPSGTLLWEDEAKNRVVTVGLNQLLTNAFKSTSVNTPWYVGICKPSVTTVSATTGSAVIGSTSAPWQSVDEGRSIVVRGAGAAGADLVTTISTVTTSSSIGLSTTATTTVTGAAAIWEARSTDTSTAHSPWTESTAYSGGARPALVLGAAAAGSIDNSGSVASYSIDTNNTLIGGAFLANSTTQLSSTDTLYGMAPFTSNGFRQLNSGDTLQVTCTLSAVSA